MNNYLSSTNISNSLNRNFGYKLSDRKAKSNLLDGANRDPFEIFERQLCSMLFFSVGSYLEAVFPTVLEWKNGKKSLQVQNLKINVGDVQPGYDKDGKHVDTVVTFKVNGQKVVATCYNTTQKIKVEGKGYLEFVYKYLKKVFIDILKSVGENKIDDYNKRVIAALSGKRKVISRPTRSIKYKSTVTLACTKCDLKFANNTQLNIHKKSSHTKSVMDETVTSRLIPIVDDLSLMDLTAPCDNIPRLELEEKCLDDDLIIQSSNCETKPHEEKDLTSHLREKHEKVELSGEIKEIQGKIQTLSVKSVNMLQQALMISRFTQ